MKLNIVCVGKLKEEWMKAAQRDYLSRIEKYCGTSVTEVKDISLNHAKSKSDIARIAAEESQSALLKCSGYIICCDLRGKRLDSVKFSQMLMDALNRRNTVSFLVGGSFGLSGEAVKKADLCLSFSDLTLPHMLFRIVLLEQIYRAFKIDKGETYHK